MVLTLLIAQTSTIDKGRANDAPAAIQRHATPQQSFATTNTKRRDVLAPARRQPLASYVSCDGKIKIETSSWQHPGGGFFASVLRRTANGRWEMLYEFRNGLAAPHHAPNRPLARKAACPVRPLALRRIGYRHGNSDDVGSPDGTLQYHWWEPGFDFSVEIWDGKDFVTVIDQRVPPGLR